MTQETSDSWAEDSASWADDRPADESVEADGTPAPGTEGLSGDGLLTAVDPADYAFSLPDGVQADPGMLEEFKGMALEMGLAPKDAQRIVDLEVKNLQTQVKRFAMLQDSWKTEISRDPEFGGERLSATVRQAKKALAAFDEGGGLKQELRSNGYANHPGIIRFLARIGKAMGEDTAHTGHGGYEPREIPLRDQLWPD